MNVLLMTEILNKLSKSKYIFIGEQHGKKAITEKVFSIIKELEGKIIFCVELPQEVEDLLQKLLQKKITEKELFASPYLEDALHDHRLHSGTLELYQKLYNKGVPIHCLESYEGSIEERDKNMAKRFLETIQNEKADYYIIYAGNVHVMRKESDLFGFHITPIPIYLPKEIVKEVITLQCTEKEGIVQCELEKDVL